MQTKLILAAYLLCSGSTVCVAQEYKPFAFATSETSTQALRETLREARNLSSSRPSIEPTTLSADDIDSIILQKLYYTLQSDPGSFQATTGFSDAEVSLLVENLENFSDVVLQQQKLVLDDMCQVWNPAVTETDAMIDETLAAFDDSRINRSPITFLVMQDLLSELERELSAEQLYRFNELLDISRTEVAGSSVYTFAQNARIMGDTQATLRYHCEGRNSVQDAM